MAVTAVGAGAVLLTIGLRLGSKLGLFDSGVEKNAVDSERLSVEHFKLGRAHAILTSSPTFALRVSGGGYPLLGDSCSRSTWFLLHRAA